MTSSTDTVYRLEEYKPAAYQIPLTELDFSIYGDDVTVCSKLHVVRASQTSVDQPLVLNGDELELSSLRIDGNAVPASGYSLGHTTLSINEVPKKPEFIVEIGTRLKPVENTKLMGLYKSNGVFTTQCEAEGFRRITFFLDRPDVLSRYRVRIEAGREATPLLLSNGNMIEKGDLPEDRHYVIWDDPHPKPSYLFALVAGNLSPVTDHFVTADGRDVELAIYVEAGKESRASYAMDALKRSMRWDEETYGRVYDLDVFNIVAVSDFNMGAMENKGLNIFNDKFVLADWQTATDTDYANIEAIIAHEYFHNWTGNRITCRDWFQLCLKEGLTVYRDHQFSAGQRNHAVKRIGEIKLLRAHQFPEDSGPLAHPVRPEQYAEINNFYTATVYEKGSELVRMLHKLLGDKLYRQTMDRYFETYDGQAITVEDFLSVFEEISGRSLSQFMLWYSQAGTPNLTIWHDYCPQKCRLTLSIEQSLQPTKGQSQKRPMLIPVRFALIGEGGAEVEYGAVEGAELAGDCLLINKREHHITFHEVQSPAIPSLLRGFSAPVTMLNKCAETDDPYLAINETEPVARWQALNACLIRQLVSSARLIAEGNQPQISSGMLVKVITPFASAYGDDLEPEYRALCLTLPGENDVAREFGSNVNPDRIRQARDSMARDVANKHGEHLLDIYNHMAANSSRSVDAVAAGRRSLKNAVLDYCSLYTCSADLAFGQFESAENMTDQMAALVVLANRFATTRQAQSAIEQFEKRFGDQPLAMDKWFTAQALIPGEAALDRVKALVEHPGYDASNPNRVRALIGTFSGANPTGFHRTDGKAYDFVCETIIQTDRSNPQLAARLLTALRSWRCLEPERAKQAKRALQTIYAQQSLSVDVKDILTRILE